MDVVDYRWLGAAAVLILSATAVTLLFGRTPAAPERTPAFATLESGTLR